MKLFYETIYRYSRAPWDIGAWDELVSLVESGRIKPCRAIDLGCGTGANAKAPKRSYLLARPLMSCVILPPWEANLIDGLSPIVQVAHATLETVPTGRASPRYLPNWQGSGPVGLLPPVQRQVYELVERSGVITAHALADALEMSHANAATVLLELYHRGLVDREPIRNSEGLHYSWRLHHGGSRK